MTASIAFFLSYAVLTVAPSSADPKPVQVMGTVVEPSGQPAARADLWIVDAIGADDARRFGAELRWSMATKPSEGTIPVLLRSRTDAAGRFTFELPAEIAARRVPPLLAIWAATGGHDRRFASRLLPRVVLVADPPARLELHAPFHTRIAVRDPDEQPVAGARITPSRACDIFLPEPLGLALAATTDAKGQALISGPVPEEIRVESPQFGVQTIRISDSQIPGAGAPVGAERGVAVTLAAVGRIEGHLVAPGNDPIKGVRVKATTQAGGYSGSGQTGSAEVSCDARGQFAVPAIAAGTLTLALVFDREDGTALCGEPPRELLVKPHESTQVAIPLRPAVKMHGQYREQGTKRPIAAVKLLLNSRYGGDRFAVTGADGTFVGWFARDLPFGRAWPVRIPAPYYNPGEMAFAPLRMPAAGSNEKALPPVELRRGIDVEGSVVNQLGRPVAGAEVEASWREPIGLLASVLARTDQSGHFTLCGVDAIAELTFTASDGLGSTVAAVVIRAQAACSRPVVLTIDPRNTMPAGGRVSDLAGNPVAAALIQIWRRVRDSNGREMLIDPVGFGDRFRSIRTDAHGHYLAPRRLPPGGEYYAQASAPRMLTAFSPAIKLTREVHEFPPILLRRVRTVEGTVVDRHDKPVSGALVRQSGDGPIPTQAVTAPDGRFRLPGVLEGPTVVFAQKDGFRFQFQPVDDGAKPIKVVLTHETEAPLKNYETLAPALPVEQEKALARRLIQPCAEKVLAKGNDVHKYRFLLDAIGVDPSAVLDWLQTVKFNDPDYAGEVSVKLFGDVAQDSVEEATALVEASADATSRARGYLEICEVRRDLDRGRVKELLAQATINARVMRALPGIHVRLFTAIADRLVDIGSIDEARKLLQEAESIVKEMSKNNDRDALFLGSVAVDLARIDLPAALAMLDRLEPAFQKAGGRGTFFDRSWGIIACKLGEQSPADVERVLLRLSRQPQTAAYVAAACSRMAPKDLARARRIAAARISPDAPGYMPYTLGLMAQAIAATNKSEAARLIEDAYRALEDLASKGQPASTPDCIAVAAGLLSIAEQAAPERLGAYLGRTLLLRRATGDQTDPGEVSAVHRNAVLAMMVARYDRRLAAGLIEAELREIGTHAALGEIDLATATVLSALALIDPQQAVERVEALPDDPGAGSNPETTKNQARMRVAAMLARHGAQRWGYIYEVYLRLWTPDQRDL